MAIEISTGWGGKIFVSPHPNHCKDVCKGFVLLVKVLSITVKFVN
jgi:hypothetical protein